jgi:uncharacterized protein (TIGR00369 family)
MSDRTRTYSWDDPFDFIAGALHLTGFEAMQKMAAGELPQPPIGRTLGFRLAEVEHGRAVFEAEPAEYHYNPIGTVHAGLAATLLDSAMGCALVTTLPPATRWTTLELKASFTRAMTVDTGPVRAIGTVVHPGRRVVTTDGRIEDREGRLIAHGTGTILMLDAS